MSDARGPQGMLTMIARRHSRLTKVLALTATPIFICIVFIKFAADISQTVFPPRVPSPLSEYSNYWNALGGVMRPRIGGNYGIYWLAKAINRLIGIPRDPRLHPLRLAAIIASTVSVWIGTLPVIRDESGEWDWRVFFAGYLFMSLLSFYCYMPYDMPSTALISVGLWLLLHRRPGAGFVVMLLAGLFRESALHLVWFATCLWFLPELSPGIGWVAAYSVGFFLEWAVIRHFLPTPNVIRFRGLWSDIGGLTLWASLGMVAWFSAQSTIHLATAAKRDGPQSSVWKFLIVQVLMVPAWLMFYKINNGNWSEFRMLMPVVLPLVYALAYRPHAGVRSAAIGNLTTQDGVTA